MRKEILDLIFLNKLTPFNSSKTSLGSFRDSFFKTKDAKAVHTKVLSKISRNFNFNETSNLWNVFSFSEDSSILRNRQEFFKGIGSIESLFLGQLKKPISRWRPRYDIIVVTEEESTFVSLQSLGCTVSLLINDQDVQDLERYDIVQVVDCDNFKGVLERLPQSVFIDSIDNVYLERYLEELSGWRENFNILRRNETTPPIKVLLDNLEHLFDLLDNREGNVIKEEDVERVLEEINEKITSSIKNLTISGDVLMKMLGEGKMPEDILGVVRGSIESSGLPEHIFNLKVPVTIDYKELEDQIKRQSANEFTNLAEGVKRRSEELKDVPRILSELSALLLLEDFYFGVSRYLRIDMIYPTFSENFHMSRSLNYFLDKASPIDFQLDSFSRCSILTGANSGGKTTLLEHIIQNITFFQLGLPVFGEVHMPIFTDIYYFAKNKGSASKGAFETLLTQMSKIRSGGSVLILADEIEAVTEPGIAGKIIASTAEFFIKRGCYLVFATHLGQEIRAFLPEGARIDGIEAKGLDSNFNLIVEHNPVLGRLASSTPELIVERMANSNSGGEGAEYFSHLFRSIKKD